MRWTLGAISVLATGHIQKHIHSLLVPFKAGELLKNIEMVQGFLQGSESSLADHEKALHVKQAHAYSCEYTAKNLNEPVSMPEFYGNDILRKRRLQWV